MPAAIPPSAVVLVVSALEALIALAEKRRKEGEAAREEVANTADMDAAHEALQAAFAPAGVDVGRAEVDADKVDAALPLLKTAAAILKGEC